MVKSNIMGIGWKEQDNDVKIYQDIYRRLDSAEHHQLRIIRCKYLRQRGIVFVWVAMTIFVLVLLVGLTLDTARVLLIVHQLQNGADAAALAGARLVKINHVDAQLQAIAIAAENFADKQSIELTFNEDNLPDGDMVVGRYDRVDQIFTPIVPGTGPVNALKVVARRTADAHEPIPLIFGPLVDVFTSNISRYAIAMPVGGDGAGLIALRPDKTGLWVHGNLILNVNSTTGNPNDGAIQVNSTDDDGFWAGGASVTVEAELINVGGEDIRVSGGFTTSAQINRKANPIPDPLNWLDDYRPPLTADQGAIDIVEGSATLDPGYYSGGIRMTGGLMTLNPGIYILGGGTGGQKRGLVVNGGVFDAHGVMFYIIDNGVVEIGGNAQVNATPMQEPDYSGPYEGILIWQDDQNHNEAQIGGIGALGSVINLEGTLYFPENHITLTGTSGALCAQLIAWEIEIAGDGVFNINYDGRFKTLPFRSFLVE